MLIKLFPIVDQLGFIEEQVNTFLTDLENNGGRVIHLRLESDVILVIYAYLPNVREPY